MSDMVKGLIVTVVGGLIVGIILLLISSGSNVDGNEITYESDENVNTDLSPENPKDSSVFLADLEPYAVEKKSEGYVFLGVQLEHWHGDDADNLGNIYSNGFKHKVYDLVEGKEYSTSLLFDLKSNYSYITGYFVLHEDSKNYTDDKYYARLFIFSDGVEVYSSDILRGGVRPIAFNVQIDSPSDLKITIKCSKDLNVGIVDTALHP